jgi:hypothetical protein
MRIFYGSDKTFANDMPEDLRLAMLPTDANKARREIEKSFPVDDPKSAFGVVWTAYDTVASRTMTSTPHSHILAIKVAHEKGSKQVLITLYDHLRQYQVEPAKGFLLTCDPECPSPEESSAKFDIPTLERRRVMHQ